MTRDEFEQALAEYERVYLDVNTGHHTPNVSEVLANLAALRATLVAMATRGAVPREPTRAMLDAADPINNFEQMNYNVWRAMYDAALAQPSEAGKDTRAKAEPCSSVAQEVEVDHWNAPHFGLTAAPNAEPGK